MIAKEAIETLKANYPDACYEQLREAVDAAIEALKAQGVAGDTIYRQTAIDAMYKILHDYFWANDEELDAVITTLNELPSAQPEVAKDICVPINDCISRKAVKYKLTALVNELEEIFSHIREHNVDDSVCGLCEYDGAYIGESGDWCNECPGFDKDDCFKLKEKYREEWLKIDG